MNAPISPKDLRRAAYWLSVNAKALKDCHTIKGRFVGEPEVEAEYTECRDLARKLRLAARTAA